MFHETNVRSVVVKLTVEDRDTICFDIKQLNWDNYLERWVKGMRQYIVNDDLSALPQARERYKMQVYKQQTIYCG
jgi:fatty acyl-CoA reductase